MFLIGRTNLIFRKKYVPKNSIFNISKRRSDFLKPNKTQLLLIPFVFLRNFYTERLHLDFPNRPKPRFMLSITQCVLVIPCKETNSIVGAKRFQFPRSYC